MWSSRDNKSTSSPQNAQNPASILNAYKSIIQQRCLILRKVIDYPGMFESDTEHRLFLRELHRDIENSRKRVNLQEFNCQEGIPWEEKDLELMHLTLRALEVSLRLRKLDSELNQWRNELEKGTQWYARFDQLVSEKEQLREEIYMFKKRADELEAQASN